MTTPARAEASKVFGDHCDIAHPPAAPFDLVRRNVTLTETGPGQWTSPSLSGRRYTIQRTHDGRYRVGTLGGRNTVQHPLASVERAQLCIAQLARLVDGCHAEAVHRHLVSEERATTRTRRGHTAVSRR